MTREVRATRVSGFWGIREVLLAGTPSWLRREPLAYFAPSQVLGVCGASSSVMRVSMPLPNSSWGRYLRKNILGRWDPSCAFLGLTVHWRLTNQSPAFW